MDGAKIMRMPAKIIALTAILTGLAGCSSKLETNDVTGTYQAVFSYGVETLTLRADGNYEQSFKYNDGKELSNKGTWQFWPGSKNVIRLNDALMVDDNFGKPAATVGKGAWGIEARKNSLTGSITLNWNDDLGVAFKKK